MSQKQWESFKGLVMILNKLKVKNGTFMAYRCQGGIYGATYSVTYQLGG